MEYQHTFDLYINKNGQPLIPDSVRNAPGHVRFRCYNPDKPGLYDNVYREYPQLRTGMRVAFFSGVPALATWLMRGDRVEVQFSYSENVREAPDEVRPLAASEPTPKPVPPPARWATGEPLDKPAPVRRPEVWEEQVDKVAHTRRKLTSGEAACVCIFALALAGIVAGALVAAFLPWT